MCVINKDFNIIWKYFIKEILTKNYKITQINGSLIHGGGWNKLAGEAVDNIHFKKSIYRQHLCG